MNLRQRASAVIAAISGKGISREDFWYSTATSNDRRRGNRHTAQNFDALGAVTKMQGYANSLAVMKSRDAANVPVRVYRRAKPAAMGRRYGAKSASLKAVRHLNSGNAGRKVAEWASMGGELEEVTEGPILDFLATPNPDMTAGQISRLRYLDLQQAGQAFDAVLGKKNAPEGSYRLDPIYTLPQPNEQTGIVDAFAYGRDAQRVALIPAEDVLWWRHDINPRDPYDGWSWARDVLDQLDILAAHFANELGFIESGQRPDSVFALPAGTDPKILEAFRVQLEQRHRGISKRAAPLVTSGDVQVTPLGWAPKDLLTNEMRESMYRDIRNAAGVPESMADLNDANLASSLMGFDRQYAHGIRQMVNAQSELETKYIPRLFEFEPGEYVIVADDPMPSAVVEETQRHVARVAAGLMTINEAREEAGDDPSADPAAAKLRINGQTLEALDREPPAPLSFGFGGPSSPPAASEPAPAVPSLPTAPAPEKAVSEPVVERPIPAAPASPDPSTSPDVKAWLSIEDDPWADPGCGCVGHKDGTDLPLILNAADEAIRSLADKVEAYERDLIRRFLADPTLDTRQLTKELEALLGEDIERVMAQTAFDTAGLPGSPDSITDAAQMDRFNLVNERTLARAAEVSKELAAKINETTLNQVQNALTRGLEEGQSIGQIAEAIEGSDIPRSRANTIARTELSRAHGAGQLEGFKATGVTHKRWDAAPGACPICKAIAKNTDNGGKGIPVDEPFWAGGPLTGTDGKTYNVGVVMTHPAHPNDRCEMRQVGGD